jgi:hypothetical protein
MGGSRSDGRLTLSSMHYVIYHFTQQMGAGFILVFTWAGDGGYRRVVARATDRCRTRLGLLFSQGLTPFSAKKGPRAGGHPSAPGC